VDFNGDFYANRPQEEQAEALAVLSVVNTLCELEQVNQVQLYTEGRRLERYEYLDLSAPLLMDSAVVGPVREELGEFAGTLCLPGRSDGLLHRLTVRCRARGGATREEALLDVLLGRTAQNGLTSPLAGVRLLSVQTEDGVCRLSLSPESLPTDPETRASALRSLAATLCTLPEVDAVGLTGEEGLLVPAPDWFAAGETSPLAP
jgi:spore germination protein GerM